ncbi:hypothetical protein CGZ93_07710 [Enemella dayhoffiae]|uniref:Uncharacterized protein n=1 Tax=Enemella dayhoffiae TaxID=2016507 RepID=A0A255H4G5_9ACTN|nr:hypothetical protein [Enemella dayhoffiae]OYO22412.1 hypothetical protein CGZ93_07710 [Enemella dayhoffiae]
MRDRLLPVEQRYRSFGSCVQFSCPIGFEATWSYLQSVTGRPWRDPMFLLPALGILEQERALRMAEEVAYANLRRTEKAAGRRTPTFGCTTPTWPQRWHGDERAGATHALRVWRRRNPGGGPFGDRRWALVLAAVDSLLAGAPHVDTKALQRCLDWARRLHRTSAVGSADSRVAFELEPVLGQLQVHQRGAVVVNTPWGFTR